MTSLSSPPGAERIIRWIMLGIVAWGLFHAIGAWRLKRSILGWPRAS
jgi:hypothetical protein